MKEFARRDMTASLSPSQIETFRRDGALLVKSFLDPYWVDLMRGVFEALKDAGTDMTGYNAEQTGTVPARSTLVKDDVWKDNEDMRRFLRESPVAANAAALMGSKVAKIYEDLLIYKAAGTSAPTPWHQDEPQWPLTGQHLSSVWFCLDPVTRDTGALRFIAGSNRGPLYVPYVPSSMKEQLAADMDFFTGGQMPEVDADQERFPVLCFDTEPGDVVFFHPRTIHAAIGNKSAQPRRTFSIRFIGEDVRWQPKASVVLPWLKDVDLMEGDAVTGPRFPQFWPQAKAVH